jgi:hypothetical protein
VLFLYLGSPVMLFSTSYPVPGQPHRQPHFKQYKTRVNMPSAEFDAAAAKAKLLSKASNDDLLALYKYFKQVSFAWITGIRGMRHEL